MVSIAAFAGTAALVGDPARANMLAALMDGRALTAAELAAAASITPQTATSHLARLTQAGLLSMQKQGRHRYHRLASPGVARMLEGIMAVAGAGPDALAARRPVVVGPRDAAMRAARTCYDHLAGRLAVAMADAMAGRGQLEFSDDGGAVTADGTAFLRSLGIDTAAAQGAGVRVFCRPCLDWSERRPHIAGALGAALCARCFALGWVRRVEGTRAVSVTAMGRGEIRRCFGVDC